MKVAIIDDDISFCQKLEICLKQHDFFQNIQINQYHQEFHDIQLEQYELLFIDIMLGETNGIAIAQTIKNKKAKIIFISSNGSFISLKASITCSELLYVPYNLYGIINLKNPLFFLLYYFKAIFLF